MSAQQYTVGDINEMSADELEEASEDELPDDIDITELEFPSFRHHMRVRQKLEVLGDYGLMTDQQIDEIYTSWLDDR